MKGQPSSAQPLHHRLTCPKELPDPTLHERHRMAQADFHPQELPLPFPLPFVLLPETEGGGSSSPQTPAPPSLLACR